MKRSDSETFSESKNSVTLFLTNKIKHIFTSATHTASAPAAAVSVVLPPLLFLPLPLDWSKLENDSSKLVPSHLVSAASPLLLASSAA